MNSPPSTGVLCSAACISRTTKMVAMWRFTLIFHLTRFFLSLFFLALQLRDFLVFWSIGFWNGDVGSWTNIHNFTRCLLTVLTKPLDDTSLHRFLMQAFLNSSRRRQKDRRPMIWKLHFWINLIFFFDHNILDFWKNSSYSKSRKCHMHNLSIDACSACGCYTRL